MRAIGLNTCIFALAAAMALAAPAHAGSASGPAVSDTNFKLEGIGGIFNNSGEHEAQGGIAGSLTLPAGYNFGLQFDGAYMHVQDDDLFTGGAHVFWRDPKVGMFGLYAGITSNQDHGESNALVKLERFGVEGQLFSRSLTAEGAVGWEGGDIDGRVYGDAKLDLYLGKNWMVKGGFTYEGTGFATWGSEYQFASDSRMGISLFSDSNFHSSDNYSFLAGMKITFGKQMDLIDRHRRQDPDNYLGADTIGSQQIEASKTRPVCPAIFAQGTDCACPDGKTAQLTMLFYKTGIAPVSFPNFQTATALDYACQAPTTPDITLM